MWHHDMKLPYYTIALREGNPPVTGLLSSQMGCNENLWCFLVVSQNKLLNKQSYCRGFETTSVEIDSFHNFPNIMGPKPNFRCEVADVKEEIHIEFRGMLCVSMEYDKPCQEIFHNIFSPTIFYNNYLSSVFLHAICNTFHHNLWIAVKSLWHWNYPGTRIALT